ncbi:putative T7SS-secreted protein [Streptomyces sp. SGAir0957]
MSWRGIFIADDSSWPGLGFNPARGEVAAIDHLATDLKAVGRGLDELHGLVTGVGKDHGFWRGEGADAFRKKLGKLPHYLQQGNDSMSAAGRALLHWHDTLDSLQRQADPLESDAVTARRDWERLAGAADTAMAHATTPSGDPQTDKQHSERAKTASQEAHAAKEKLDGLVRQGEELHKKWREAAARAEHAIREATDLAPESIGLWERVTDGLKGALHDFTDWLVEHADTLSTISSGLALAAVAVQAIPVVGQAAGAVLGTGAVLCSAGALVGHVVGMRRGNGSGWLDLAGDALGVVPGWGLVKGGAQAGKAVVVGGRLAAVGRFADGAEVARGAKGFLKEGAVAAGTKLRAGLAQQGIDKAAVPLAKRFGVELTGKKLHSFQVGSQTLLRANSFVHKLAGGE